MKGGEYMDNQGASAEMPRYKCFKEVWALQIEGIEKKADGGALIEPVNRNYAKFEVDAAYMQKHKPEVGGYYVVYKDGYKSYSPAKAFEEGYSRT